MCITFDLDKYTRTMSKNFISLVFFYKFMKKFNKSFNKKVAVFLATLVLTIFLYGKFVVPVSTLPISCRKKNIALIAMI